MIENYGRFALFDWDNTLRRGFTIVSWVKYLYDQHIVDKNNYINLLYQFKLYESKKISYQQLSDNTALIYARSITGEKVSNLEQLAYDFCQQDQCLFAFAKPLLEICGKTGIEIIVISGSPKLVLIKYAKKLGLNVVYGMDIEIQSGRYTGRLTNDYGAEKQKIVCDICKSRESAPLFAFGDSIADAPLLKASKYGFLIGENGEQISLNGTVIQNASSISEAVKSLCL